MYCGYMDSLCKKFMGLIFVGQGYPQKYFTKINMYMCTQTENHWKTMAINSVQKSVIQPGGYQIKTTVKVNTMNVYKSILHVHVRVML